MTGRQMIKLYLSEGWIILRIKGSHHILIKKEEMQVIPHHNRELDKRAQAKYLKKLREVR